MIQRSRFRNYPKVLMTLNFSRSCAASVIAILSQLMTPDRIGSEICSPYILTRSMRQRMITTLEDRRLCLLSKRVPRRFMLPLWL